MGKLEKQSASPPPGQIKHDDHSIGTLDSSSADSNGNVFFGSGNTAEHYNISVDSKTHIELGLKLHVRQGDDILPTSVDADGTAHYQAPAGEQPGNPQHRAAWNFDFSVNTGLDGSTKTLDDFNFRIIIADDDGNSQAFDLQHVAPGNTPWLNVTTGSGATLGGFADEDGTAHLQLSQNSVNMNFGFLAAAFGPDNMTAGEQYDITLQAFNPGNGNIVAQVHDHILLV